MGKIVHVSAVSSRAEGVRFPGLAVGHGSCRLSDVLGTELGPLKE